MLVYRIADCRYINDLSGRGAALNGGRWNSKEVYILYTAENPALALLEAVVHFGKIPERRYCMIVIDLPDGHIDSYPATQLPADWYKSPAPDSLRKVGDQFIQTGRLLGLKVPSVIMPEVNNVLLNPGHSDFHKIKIANSRLLSIDERLLNPKG